MCHADFFFCYAFSGNKSYVAFTALIYLLPGRPRKGVKKPRLSAEARVQSFFLDYKVRVLIFFNYYLTIKF